MHLLRDGVIPKGIAILLVNHHGFLNRLWKFYHELHHPIDILLHTELFHLRDDSVSFLQHVLFPPVESRLMTNLLKY